MVALVAKESSKPNSNFDPQEIVIIALYAHFLKFRHASCQLMIFYIAVRACSAYLLSLS
jgi:hypothetical protein